MNAKRKGNKGEWDFVHWLRSHGFNSHRNAMSGGTIFKGDVANDLDFTIEIKTVKKINLQQAWRQVENDASKARNEAVLAIRFDKMPKNQWLVVMHSEDWIEYVKASKNRAEPFR